MSAWKHITIANTDRRKEINHAAISIMSKRKMNLLQRVFAGLYAGTVGHSSAKHEAQERRLLAVALRQKLSEEQISRGESGVVIEDDFKRHFRRYMVSMLECF